MKKISVKVEKTTTGYSAYTDKYMAFTTGKNAAELITNMTDSLNLYFKEAGTDKIVSPNDISLEM